MIYVFDVFPKITGRMKMKHGVGIGVERLENNQ
jgi:hypothetical protein